MENQELKRITKVGYGFGELGSVLFWSSLSFLLINYLTDEVGLTAGLAGTALMTGKIWDAVSDPAVGFLSDRTRSSMGRRRPWILFGAVPLGILYAFLFRNPGMESQAALFTWALILYILLCTAYTAVNIPYIALIPELTEDYDERTNLNGYRSIFSILGTLVGAGVAVPLLNSFSNRTVGYRMVGILFGVVIVISSLIPFFAVKEKKRKIPEKRPTIIQAYLGTLKNRPYRILLISFGFATAGISIITAILIYYFKYIFGNENLLTGALLSLLTCSMVFIPFSVILSRKLGKREVYMGGLVLLSLGLVLVFLFGHRVSVFVVYGFLSISGIGLSTHYVLPWSMLPDAVEVGKTRDAGMQEGVYFGLWTFISKIGTALAGLIIGWGLNLSHYQPNIHQTPEALLGIRFLAGPATVLFFLGAFLMISRYPLDRSAYEHLRQETQA